MRTSRKLTHSDAKANGVHYDLLDRDVVKILEGEGIAYAIYCYLLTKSETWNPNRKDIQHNLGFSPRKISHAFKVLREKGLLELDIAHDEHGRFIGKRRYILITSVKYIAKNSSPFIAIVNSNSSATENDSFAQNGETALHRDTENIHRETEISIDSFNDQKMDKKMDDVIGDNLSYQKFLYAFLLDNLSISSMLT